MVVKVEEPKREGLKKTLSFKDLLEGEYVIISLSGNYPRPITGQAKGNDGRDFEWNLFDINLHEYCAIDLKSLKKDVQKYDTPLNVSMFANTEGLVYKNIHNKEFGQKLKITMDENEKTGKKYYRIEELDKPTDNNNNNDEDKKSEMLITDRVKELKNSGVEYKNIVDIITKEFNTNEGVVKGLYNAF